MAVIDHLDVVEDIGTRLTARGVYLPTHAFALEQLEEALSHGVVMAVATPAHAADKVVVAQEPLPLVSGEICFDPVLTTPGRGRRGVVRGQQGSYDNALAETINDLYKAEVIHRRNWSPREAVELATLTWVSWFNNHRLMGQLNYIPPALAGANYYRQFSEQSAAAA